MEYVIEILIIFLCSWIIISVIALLIESIWNIFAEDVLYFPLNLILGILKKIWKIISFKCFRYKTDKNGMIRLKAHPLYFKQIGNSNFHVSSLAGLFSQKTNYMVHHVFDKIPIIIYISVYEDFKKK